MTDNTVPNSVPDPMDDSFSTEHEAAHTEPSAPAEASPEFDWEPVNFPGQLSLEDDGSSSPSSSPSQAQVDATVLPPANSHESPSSTEELIQLIQDLNHCNDALLHRISTLEESLEQSQTALQTEIERSQAVGSRVGAAPQQVAQLLGELDIANDGLRRTTMHNEALQAELDISQQRVAQLERECTLQQQRFNEKSTALQQAETTCRDLKARLNRQQRYTLQFKAALEKCLNMSTQQTSGEMATTDPAVASDPAVNPVAMPKSQQIQPWSAGDRDHSQHFNLRDLLQSIKEPSQATASYDIPGADVSQPNSLPDKVADPEAEALLWQDLARVTEAQPRAAQPDSATSVADDREADPWFNPEPARPEPGAPEPNATRSTEADNLAFTEPSPWGAPLNAAPAEGSASPTGDLPSTGDIDFAASEELPAVQPQQSAPAPQTTLPVAPPVQPSPQETSLPGYLQGASQGGGASPAPLVYPLRSQKKRKSLAAVELPSFGRPARRR